MAKSLKASDVNHLRRMVAWVRCEYFMTPEELVAVVRDNAAVLGEPSPEAKARLVAWYGEKKAVPKYVHAAVKALEKVYQDEPGEIVDGENVSASRLEVKPLPISGTVAIVTEGDGDIQLNNTIDYKPFKMIGKT